MMRLAISVEGETEEEFVKRVLADYLRSVGIKPIPYLLQGNITVPRLGGEMARLLGNHDAVTSLVDFYGFTWTNERLPIAELENRLTIEVRRNLRIVPDPLPVIPYVQQYEFEGLLFSDVEAFGIELDLPESAVDRLRQIRQQFATPEEINDSTITAPSKRIADIMPRYNKVVYGYLLAQEIGLHRIRTECPRFNQWMADLEALAQ